MADKEIPYDLTEKSKLRIVKKFVSASKLLKQIGALLVQDSREAFQNQRFGDLAWPKTYPRQKPPRLNVAWTLKDFGAGRTKPDSRRFDQEFAGVATGNEPSQVASKVIYDETIELGTSMEGALGMQTGNVTGKIPVTPETKDLINDWLYKGRRKKMFFSEFVTAGQMRRMYGKHWKPSEKTKPRKGSGNTPKGKRSKDGYETVTEFENQKYEKHLKKFLKPTLTEYEIKGYRRPFLGITQQRSEDITELLSQALSE